MNQKIAVPVDDKGILDGHFGHCRYFALHEIEGGKIISEEKVAPPRHEPGVLPKWIAGLGVSDVIAGGMGNRAIQIFNYHNVNVFVGAPQMAARDIVEGFLNNSINFSANYCDH